MGSRCAKCGEPTDPWGDGDGGDERCRCTPTPPAPADDATRESAPASGEAMRQACIAACHGIAFKGTRGNASTVVHVVNECAKAIRALPLPAADDASGAEAMREAFVAHMATVGVTDVAWTNALGPVGTRADHYGVMLSVEWERFAAGYYAALRREKGCA